MSRDIGFKDFVIEQLAALQGLRVRGMFGGFGLYQDEKFFGIISGGAVYFKTNETTRADYEKYASRPFQPSAKQTLKNYYEVPSEILDNSPELIVWAEKPPTFENKAFLCDF